MISRNEPLVHGQCCFDKKKAVGGNLFDADVLEDLGKPNVALHDLERGGGGDVGQGGRRRG